ncbi:MAG: hypothetical protein ABI416_01805 [Ginsengibacter sp.]
MRVTAILKLFMTIVMPACKKNKILKDEYTTLDYKQTFCADPWPIGGTDSLTLKNLAAYLDSSGLYLAGLTIKKEADEDLCYACFCKTGKTIYATTLASDTLKARYGRLGFK